MSRCPRCRHELELVAVGPRTAPRSVFYCPDENLAFDEEPSAPDPDDEFPRSSDERHDREDRSQ